MLTRRISNASGHLLKLAYWEVPNYIANMSQNHRRLSENTRGTLIVRMMNV